jgi:hypothetical protein
LRGHRHQTGFKRSAITSEGGLYVFAGLSEGTYTVRAQKEGFRPTEQTGVVLDAATRRSIDFRLEVGGLAESVTVSGGGAGADGLGRRNAGHRSRQLSQIALNGGNYTQLLRLIPGAVATTLDPFGLALSTTGQRINGIRTDSIVFSVDGAENMDNGGNSNAAINPSADAIAEVKILTSGYSAEFGGLWSTSLPRAARSATMARCSSSFATTPSMPAPSSRARWIRCASTTSATRSAAQSTFQKGGTPIRASSSSSPARSGNTATPAPPA